MHNKRVIVTGASSGIGQAAAQELACMGASVVLVCRSRERGEAARNAMVAACGHERLDLLLADFADLAQVRRVAAEINERYQQIDVLVNNAGLFMARREQTTDGFEMTFGVNHLAPFLLTSLLLDRLKATGTARIVNVASGAHYPGHLNFADLNRTKGNFNGMASYCDSKLANVLFSAELARRLAGTGVTSNSLSPGGVATNFALNAGGFFSTMVRLFRPFMKSPAQGARTIVYLASSPEVEGISGQYFDDCKPRTPSSEAQDQAIARQLWTVSEQLVGLA